MTCTKAYKDDINIHLMTPFLNIQVTVKAGSEPSFNTESDYLIILAGIYNSSLTALNSDICPSSQPF
jgi:hypothetical protein